MFGTHPDQVEGQISPWTQGLTDEVEQCGTRRTQVEQIQVTESSADGAVRVTIDSSGAPIDLTLTGKISCMPPSEVAAVVTDCMRRAQQQLAGQMRHAMAATVGAEEPLGQDQDDRTEPDAGVLERSALNLGEINDSPPRP